MSLAEVYEPCRPRLELDWYENIGLCKPGDGGTSAQRRSHHARGKVPVNPSGGLACFGEAVPRAGDRSGVRTRLADPRPGDGPQVKGAKVGITANQVIWTRFIRDGKEVTRRASVCTTPRGSSLARPPKGEQVWQKRNIIDAVRTPVEERRRLSQVHPADLGAHSIKALMERTKVDPAAVEDVIFGCVDTIGPQAGDIAARAGWWPACRRKCRHDHRSTMRILPAGDPLRRAGRDEAAPPI